MKENCCPDSSVGGPFITFDEEDSSLMRYERSLSLAFGLISKRSVNHAKAKWGKNEIRTDFPSHTLGLTKRGSIYSPVLD